MSTTTNSLISPKQLIEWRNDSNLIVLDASIPVPGAIKKVDTKVKVIPNALRFDIEQEFSEDSAAFPHTMIAADEFTGKVKALGINQSSRIVVYDDQGIFSAPRAWWMFRAMGHADVYVLNGGLPAWQQAGYDCQDRYNDGEQPGNFQAKPQDNWFIDIEEVESALATQAAVVIDARSADRFYGRVDEPRPGVRRGNVPGAINLPFTELLDAGRYKPIAAIAHQFETLNIDKQHRLIFYCGSGVTACIPALVAKACGYEGVSVYDGSWSEWAVLRTA